MRRLAPTRSRVRCSSGRSRPPREIPWVNLRRPAASPPLRACRGRRRCGPARCARSPGSRREPGSARHGVTAGRLERIGVDLGCPWGSVAGVVGEVDDRVGSFWSQAPRKPTVRSLPEAWVTGATPTSAARACSSGTAGGPRRARSTARQRARRGRPWAGDEDLLVGVDPQPLDDLGCSARSRLWVTWMASRAARTGSAGRLVGAEAAAGVVVIRSSSTPLGGVAAGVDAAQEGGQLGLGEVAGGRAGWVAAQERDRGGRVQVGGLTIGLADRHPRMRPAAIGLCR